MILIMGAAMVIADMAIIATPTVATVMADMEILDMPTVVMGTMAMGGSLTTVMVTLTAIVLSSESLGTEGNTGATIAVGMIVVIISSMGTAAVNDMISVKCHGKMSPNESTRISFPERSVSLKP